ncbi:phage antirepressor KilAC domain-containing protein [Stenotrophomonas maltophilia]|uniref:phage antirepressor KilAC domain-containing protein n=1 Tax=Stenotrophomonas maltophilia TaxID=40324 RepID=UPI0009BDE8FA|nr:phage regulatory protein/antirepressor Ant [Stenotrophomonas maltophilia]
MTDLVTLSGDTAVTSTLTIAENTDNEHKSVIQLVRTYVSDLEEFGRVRFEMRPFATAGGTQTREIAELNEQQATLLLTYMRNTDIVRFFKKRLVRAFFDMAQRLAAGNTARAADPMAILADPAAMRGLLLTYTEKVIDLQHTVEEQAPKVAALRRLEDAEGSFGLREAAQVLDMPERKLTRHLDAEGWIFKMPNSRRWQGYAEKRKAGLVTHKTRRYQREDGEWCEADYVRITPKGIAKLAQQFAKQSGLFTSKEPA